MTGTAKSAARDPEQRLRALLHEHQVTAAHISTYIGLIYPVLAGVVLAATITLGVYQPLSHMPVVSFYLGLALWSLSLCALGFMAMSINKSTSYRARLELSINAVTKHRDLVWNSALSTRLQGDIRYTQKEKLAQFPVFWIGLVSIAGTCVFFGMVLRESIQHPSKVAKAVLVSDTCNAVDPPVWLAAVAVCLLSASTAFFIWSVAISPVQYRLRMSAMPIEDLAS